MKNIPLFSAYSVSSFMKIWKNLASLDVQEQHSLCFCLKSAQIDSKPENKWINNNFSRKPRLIVNLKRSG